MQVRMLNRYDITYKTLSYKCRYFLVIRACFARSASILISLCQGKVYLCSMRDMYKGCTLSAQSKYALSAVL